MGKGKKIAVGIIAVLVLAGGAAAAWYFQAGSARDTAQEMTIEDQEGIETESIGSISNCLPSLPDESDDMEFDRKMAEQAYEEGKKLFDMMEESDARFFYLDVQADSFDDSVGNGVLVPEEGELVQTDKEGFARFIGKESGEDVDRIMTFVGNSLEAFLNLDADSMPDPNSSEMDADMFADRTNNWCHLDKTMSLSFGGESPKEYYMTRDLAVSCENLAADKIAVMKTSGTTEDGGESQPIYAYFGIYDASVLSKNCKGDSVYPPEGETENMKVMTSVELVPMKDNYEPICAAIYFEP